MMWRKVWGAVLDLAYPTRLSCLCCGKVLPRGTGEPLCPACASSFSPFDQKKQCPWCGGPHAASLCAPFHTELDDALCALHHLGTARTLVHALKYESLGEAAGPLSLYMTALVQPTDWDALVPLPLHKHRLRERGFNQALLLAEGVARETGLPIATPLVRIRSTRRQVGLPRSARQANVAGAFVCKDSVSGQRLLLVDDVFTTGATAKAAAAALRDADALRVGVLTATHASDDL